MLGRVGVLVGVCLFSHSVLAQTPQLAPLNPTFVAYLDAANSGQNRPNGVTPQASGLVPVPVDLSYLSAQAQAQPPGPPHQAYDPRYDLRTFGRVTPVRDQGSYGTCWSFG